MSPWNRLEEGGGRENGLYNSRRIDDTRSLDLRRKVQSDLFSLQNCADVVETLDSFTGRLFQIVAVGQTMDVYLPPGKQSNCQKYLAKKSR